MRVKIRGLQFHVHLEVRGDLVRARVKIQGLQFYVHLEVRGGAL